ADRLGGPRDLLHVRERAAPGAGQPEPHAEPVEGAVVLPGPPGAAPVLPPHDRRRDDPDVHPGRPRPGPLRRPEPEHEAGRSQDRDDAVHDAVHVRGHPHDHRVLLPGAGIQLGVAVEPGAVLRAMTASTTLTSTKIAVMVAIIVAVLFLTLLVVSIMRTRRGTVATAIGEGPAPVREETPAKAKAAPVSRRD